MGLDRLQDARSTLQTGRRISEELGVRWRLPFYQAVLGMERFLAGEWDDALAEFEEALELAAETGERYSLVLTHSLEALIALHRGELRQAEEAAAMAERLVDLLKDPERRRVMGRNGRRVVEERFSLESRLLSTSALYQRMLN